MPEVGQLYDAATAYVRRGVPVTPAYGVIVAGRSGRRPWRRTWSCACGDDTCLAPGAHPLPGAGPLLTIADVKKAWADPDDPPNVLISPSELIDIWKVPHYLGTFGMHMLEQLRPVVWPPVIQESGSWIYCTAKLEGSVIPPLGIRRLGPANTILAPPSRQPSGVRRWLWSQQFPRNPLPKPWMVLAALTAAAEQHGLWGEGDESLELAPEESSV